MTIPDEKEEASKLCFLDSELSWGSDLIFIIVMIQGNAY